MFSEAQLEAIEILSAGPALYKDVAAQVGVDVRTIARWRKDQEFRSEVKHSLYNRLSDELPAVFNVLLDKCKSGDLRAIRLLLEHLSRVDMIEVGQDLSHTIQWQIAGEIGEHDYES